MSHPTVLDTRVEVAAALGCTLGEGALWDHRIGVLLFVDIRQGAILVHREGEAECERLEMGEPVGFVALTRDPARVVAGLKSGLARVDLRDGSIDRIGSPEPDLPGNRLNDGVAGPDGALYFGSLDEEEEAGNGRFWRYDGREFTAFGESTVVTNGPAFSPDGRILYAVDTTRGLIRTHEVSDGRVGEGREFLRFAEGWGHPDGPTVDAEGYLWVCHWGGSRITRFSPGGEAVLTVPIHTAQVTKCAFGGPGLTRLYVTTAGIGRDPAIDPMAGHLFRVETGIAGRPAALLGDWA